MVTVLPATVDSDDDSAIAPALIEELPERVRAAYEIDPVARELRQCLDNKKTPSNKLPMSPSECRIDNGLIYFCNRVYVPNDEHHLRTEFLRVHHDLPLAGHVGRNNTCDLLSRHYYWPALPKDVAQYVGACGTCARTEVSHQRKRGLLKALPTPERRWQHLNMDFITGLLVSGKLGYNAILFVVSALRRCAI